MVGGFDHLEEVANHRIRSISLFDPEDKRKGVQDTNSRRCDAEQVENPTLIERTTTGTG
jgi:hypothetical protein